MSRQAVNYQFIVNRTIFEDGTVAWMCALECAEYPMLRWLRKNRYIEKEVENLEALLLGEKLEYCWGADFCLIVSQKERSFIYDSSEHQEYQEELEISAEIPTALLLKIMKDWKVFWEAVPENLFENKL